MKKKNVVFIFLFSIVALFIGLKTVNAEELTMMMQCEYKVSYGSIKGNENLYVAYTDLLNAKGDRYPLGAIRPSEKVLYTIGEITGYFGFEVNNNDRSNSTFITSMQSNKRTCPKYMTIEFRANEWWTDNYIPLFYNDLSLSSECNGTPSSKCKAYFENVKTNYNIPVDSDEDNWETYVSADATDICSDLTVNLSIKDKKIFGMPTYGRNTKYIQGINWSAAKEVQDISLFDIYNLALNSKVTKMLFDPDTGNVGGSTALTFQENGTKKYIPLVDTNSCQWPNGTTFTKGRSCKTVNDLSTVFNNYKDEIDKLYPDITATYKELSSDSYVDASGYVDRKAYTYGAENDINKLINIAAKASSINQDNSTRINEIQSELNAIINGTHASLGGNKPCQETIDKAEELIKRMSDFAEQYVKEVEVINEAAVNARNRAEKLGASKEELEKMDASIAKIEEIAERNHQFIEIVRKNLLDDANVNLSGISSSGCGIISNDMKKFLNTVLWYIRIAGIVLAIVLSLLDYVKAAAGSDDKSMAAANKKFMTRVILVAVLFLIPVILEFLLNALNISTTAGSISCLD